jgi:aryl sulfotransferase
MWHLADAWARRSEPNIVLVHYDDLSADLAGEMRTLAALLEIAVPEQAWPTLADAATFRRMRASAEQDDRLHRPPSVSKSRAAFFRRGSPGPTGNC